jgi:hypothetical protein
MRKKEAIKVLSAVADGIRIFLKHTLTGKTMHRM